MSVQPTPDTDDIDLSAYHEGYGVSALWITGTLLVAITAAASFSLGMTVAQHRSVVEPVTPPAEPAEYDCILGVCLNDWAPQLDEDPVFYLNTALELKTKGDEQGATRMFVNFQAIPESLQMSAEDQEWLDAQMATPFAGMDWRVSVKVCDSRIVRVTARGYRAVPYIEGIGYVHTEAYNEWNVDAELRLIEGHLSAGWSVTSVNQEKKGVDSAWVLHHPTRLGMARVGADAAESKHVTEVGGQHVFEVGRSVGTYWLFGLVTTIETYHPDYLQICYPEDAAGGVW